MTDKLTIQIELENLTHKNQLLPRLRREFQDPSVIAHCKAVNIPIDFATDLLAQMVLHKRAKLPVLVGILYRHFMLDRDAIPETQELQACADELHRAVDANLVDYQAISGEFVIRHELPQDVYDELERYQYPLPCIVAPKTVRDNRDTGYWGPASAKGSLILRGGHHDDDICLDHINRVNAIRLTLNHEVAETIQNKWRHLDLQKPNEERREYEMRCRMFERYDRTARDVLGHVLVTGNEFWLTHRYDKRGRVYAQGYHVNPQGNDWNKACIEFAEGEIATDAQTHTVPTETTGG